MNNIIILMDPPHLVSSYIVLAAHYDSKLMPGFVGATDSAVPCALILDLAVNLDKTVKSFRHSYKANSENDNNSDKIDSSNDNSKSNSKSKSISLALFFFDAEEAFGQWSNSDSIYGSRHLVQMMSDANSKENQKFPQLDQIEILILFDLLGSKSAIEIQPIAYPGKRKTIFKPDLMYRWISKIEHEFLRVMYKKQDSSISSSSSSIVAAVTVPAKSLLNRDINVPKGMIAIEDDHVPFIQRGIPCLHVIPNPFPREWHTLADNEKALDPALIRHYRRLFGIFLADLLLTSQQDFVLLGM